MDVTSTSRIADREIFMNEGYIPNFKMHEIKVDEIQIGTYNVAELELLLKKPDIKKVLFR